jgi:hypothetical protein
MNANRYRLGYAVILHLTYSSTRIPLSKPGTIPAPSTSLHHKSATNAAPMRGRRVTNDGQGTVQASTIIYAEPKPNTCVSNALPILLSDPFISLRPYRKMRKSYPLTVRKQVKRTPSGGSQAPADGNIHMATERGASHACSYPFTRRRATVHKWTRVPRGIKGAYDGPGER